MAREQRGRIGAAIILIAFGLYLFVVQFIPSLSVLSLSSSNWPLLIVGLGAILLIAALLTWTPGLMVPAAVLSGLGALFLWQNTTGSRESWSYAWTLIPGFVGFGILLMYLMQGNAREALWRGGPIILISLAAFILLSLFPGALDLVGQYWSLLLVVGGVFVLVQAMRRRA